MPSRNEYTTRYKKENLKRIPLEVSPDLYARIKRAADNESMSVNGFLKKCIEFDVSRYEKKYFDE